MSKQKTVSHTKEATKVQKKKKPKAKKLDGELQVETIQKQELTSKELNEQFMKAVMEGKIHKLKALLDKGADINARSNNHDYGYNTPLVNAVENGDIKIVDFLIKHGADINAEGNVLNALGCASWNGHKEIVELLIKKGADVNFKNFGGFTPLHDAARSEVEITEVLLKHGADPNIKSTNKSTALILAAEEGNLPVVKLLVENGADINAKNKYWNSALNRAFDKGHVETVAYLLTCGAEVDTTFCQKVVKELDMMKIKTIQKQKSLDDMLCNAALSGDAVAVEIALSLGANPNKKVYVPELDEKFPNLLKALCRLADRFDDRIYPGVAKHLVDYGADTTGCLHTAVLSWNANKGEVMKLFKAVLGGVTDIKEKNEVLKDAAAHGHVEKVKLLLKAGANDAVGALISAVDSMGMHIDYTFPTYAEKKACIEIVYLLKKHMEKNGLKLPKDCPEP